MAITSEKRGNYHRYQQVEWVHPDSYPLDQTPDPALYRPVAAWAGRLILPAANAQPTARVVRFEVHLAPDEHRALVSQVVDLRWSDATDVQARVRAVTKDLTFNDQAHKGVQDGYLVLPERLHGWPAVDPLESIAGAHPVDDVIVRLDGSVRVEPRPDGNALCLRIEREPVRITGRFYALVSFDGPAEDGDDRYRVRHYRHDTAAFDGTAESVRLPAVLPNSEDILPATAAGIERSPLNPTGWYIYGALDRDGVFVVQALAPRTLLRATPQRVISGEADGWQYIRHEAWRDPVAQKGNVASVLVSQDAANAAATWPEGTRALVAHVYSGVGGKKREKAAKSGLYFGHFSFGIAAIVREPLADELSFDIVYYQIYASNVDGIIPGANAWSHYVGDRQFGWLGTRPICDTLLMLDGLDDAYAVDGVMRSAMGEVIDGLEMMAARYRIADGHGATYVGAANNCAQDSGQALYAALVSAGDLMRTHPEIAAAARERPDGAARLAQLQALGPDLRRQLIGSRVKRADWREGEATLGLSAGFLTQLRRGLATWHMLLPRKASDTIVRAFLRHGASAWVLRTSQVGGDDPDIEPIAPLTF